MTVRKTYTGQFEGTVTFEALKAEKTLSEWASPYEVPLNQMKPWKRHLHAHVDELFEDKRWKREKDNKALIEELYK